jgi:phosphomannomutase
MSALFNAPCGCSHYVTAHVEGKHVLKAQSTVFGGNASLYCSLRLHVCTKDAILQALGPCITLNDYFGAIEYWTYLLGAACLLGE